MRSRSRIEQRRKSSSRLAQSFEYPAISCLFLIATAALVCSAAFSWR
ncbi:hypothetical protein ALQ36_103380 [Pseudomonas syringae pv. primulae]|uniref:Uncharacterized protein n=1 Tax=Pseudomonas syringae pv. primulae TaxID=251707 RepID=A0A3M3Y9V7_9PSED|nr:hypothetical protein ALQ36_103380 [Pseudomonas syringae pv. primulae]